MKQENLAPVLDLFDKADANGDGVMDQAEYTVFVRSFEDYRANKYGDVPRFDEPTLGQWWTVQNKITPGVEGISKDDLVKSDMIMGAIRQMA